MITCIKHNVEFIKGECPRCKELREGISLNYKSSNPEHKSDFIMDKIQQLNIATNKLKDLNNRLIKLSEDYKENK